MRIFWGILVLGLVNIVLFFELSSTTFAHAGVQKRNSEFIVTFYQSPISPLVGENVKVTFVVTDHNLNSQKGLEGRLNLIDTFYGDESKDKKILERTFKTDANGAFEFEYTFNKENYFNIELQFKGREEKVEHVDFLVQPRKVKNSDNIPLPTAVTIFVFGSLVGIFITFILKRKEHK